MHTFTEPRTRAGIAATYPLMAQLRPELAAGDYVRQVAALMREEGFRLVVLHAGARAVALAGYRSLTMLHCGRVLWVDDLVVDACCRGAGFGGRLLAWLEARARRDGCRQLQLVSRVAREKAHRFYYAHRFGIECFHFRKPLDGASAPPA